jgi:hypothetical protein
MKNFDRGVSYYTKATVEIGFPEDDCVCHWCPMLAPDYRLEREYCKRTGEILLAPKHQIGFYCPLKFNTEVDDETS